MRAPGAPPASGLLPVLDEQRDRADHGMLRLYVEEPKTQITFQELEAPEQPVPQGLLATERPLQTPPRHPGSSALLVMHRSLVYRGNVLG